MRTPLVLPTLVGDTVRLRGFGPADLPLVREATTDPLIPLISSVPAFGDDDACRAYLARQADRLELYVEPWNMASARTATSAGFVREGLLRSWQKVGDERKDMDMYALVSPQA